VPFRAVPLLFLTPPDSELLAFLREASDVVEQEPHVLRSIEQDLDLHGKRKKSLRQQDAQWHEARTLGLPTVGREPSHVEPEDLVLQAGRPRTSACVVYMFLVGRGYFGGFKSSQASTLLQESRTFAVFLANQGINMPGLSTRTELTHAVSNETRELILDAQLRAVLQEGWDDFSTWLADSTAVKGNTQWPKDSHLIVRLVERYLHRGRKLDLTELPCIDAPRARKVLGKLVALDRQINMEATKPGSAATRKRLYAKLLRIARKARTLIEPHVQQTEQSLQQLDVRPSRRQVAVRMVAWYRQDLQNLEKVIENCDARIMQNVKLPVGQKVRSVSDPDVGFIAKGGRESVVGYKPQLGRSSAGFVVALLVPQGNASDSGQLVPNLEQHIEHTGVVPSTGSVDDGYASAEGRNALKNRGVEVVRISGSKGKNITPAEDWDHLDYVGARDARSAVASLMCTLKHGFDFGRVARRGLENVRAEMLEDILAYNFCRMAKCRQAAADNDVALDA